MSREGMRSVNSFSEKAARKEQERKSWKAGWREDFFGYFFKFYDPESHLNADRKGEDMRGAGMSALVAPEEARERAGSQGTQAGQLGWRRPLSQPREGRWGHGRCRGRRVSGFGE